MADMIPTSESYSVEQQSWYWPKLIRRSSTGSLRSFRVADWDLQLCASIAAILAACMFCISVDHGVRPRELRTSATIGSWGQGHPQVLLTSTVAGMDLDAGLMSLNLHIARLKSPEGPGYCMQQADAGFKLFISSTVTPSAQVSLDLCQIESEHSFSMVLPLQVHQPDQPQPFDRHTAQVRVRVTAGAVSDHPALPRHSVSHTAAPSVAWDAMWAAPGLQVAVHRQLYNTQAQMLAAVVAGGAAEDDSGWGSSLHEQLVLPVLANRPSEATFDIQITRSWMVRALHLAAALVQIVVVAGCCLLLLGQYLCTYLMQRLLLCSRIHGTVL